ncbi:MAG: nucleotidyltransferase domain-containing protein [Planctomycetota bacterium]
MTSETKADLKREIAHCLMHAAEIHKVVVFGSFLASASPNDMDVAVFQDSGQSYLSLALKYRRMARRVSERIALDIIPLRSGASGAFLAEINRGEVIYER